MRLRFFTTFSIVIAVLLLTTPVSATLWEEISPEEIENRAETVVEGRFDFSEKGTFTEATAPLTVLPFKVKTVHKGEAGGQIRIGIDYYDVNNMEDFQDLGGTYLVFLEPSGKGFPMTVAGPNGVIRIGDKEVLENEERTKYFENYLGIHHWEERIVDGLLVIGTSVLGAWIGRKVWRNNKSQKR
ncbi:hypothetical protein EQV77_06215 [Halobacillus fulvus]|nr:hypothetical protein EQV77_06215 [Halobacillus fulvus]